MSSRYIQLISGMTSTLAGLICTANGEFKMCFSTQKDIGAMILDLFTLIFVFFVALLPMYGITRTYIIRVITDLFTCTLTIPVMPTMFLGSFLLVYRLTTYTTIIFKGEKIDSFFTNYFINFFLVFFCFGIILVISTAIRIICHCYEVLNERDHDHND
ncbi:hypothetical protein PFISCL1PPCAC_24552 [Pristionchus fissidentatus]|uniref:G protein-coupled receptor n=1 Tax=Pristionchus fissidentatus TaxID=1538716 RepID=A0AAV5WRS8_9BILA|nr:hypothetical protein PFISCL1PPCAC_24552 [Pristionchus fissidentatus]